MANITVTMVEVRVPQVEHPHHQRVDPQHHLQVHRNLFRRQNQRLSSGTAKIDYAKEGAADGYSFKMKNPDKTLEDVTYTYSQKAYKTAFNKSFEKAETELMNNSSSLAETNGKKDALEKEAYQ